MERCVTAGLGLGGDGVYLPRLQADRCEVGAIGGVIDQPANKKCGVLSLKVFRLLNELLEVNACQDQ